MEIMDVVDNLAKCIVTYYVPLGDQTELHGVIDIRGKYELHPLYSL
jgi:hypothetical protein